ncbi:MAG: hypothetical protein D3M94_07430 [Rhodocyclales bacterium GT-UBC]|nr:MAG: hypothetical protein D3M94_07430 [Rhodocyclales bacterium GT-UBC]
MSFEIGNLIVFPIAGFDLTQKYEFLQRESIERSITGRGIKMMTDGYNKLRVTTSGSGWMPAGLQAINRTQQFDVKCVVPRTVVADPVTRQATIPAGRRSDAGFSPWGYAIFASGESRKVGVTIGGNVATVAETDGAIGYAVAYIPKIRAYVHPPSDSGDAGTATYHWEIVVEEV